MTEPHLGAFEEVVLLAILGLAEDTAYAVPIQRRIVEYAGRQATLGSVYRTLSRLEKKGLVRSRMGAVTPEKGGKRKRLYVVSGRGRAAVDATRLVRRRLWDHIELQPGLYGAS